MKEKIEAIGENLFPAIAYGDALGLPAETMKPDRIQKQFGRLDHLISARNRFIGHVDEGRWSDDTALSLAVADALMDTQDFNMGAMAYQHIRAYEDPIDRGWGGSTSRSIIALADGVNWQESGSRNGEGNGVLMKLSPLALWQTVLKPQNGNRHVESLTNLTHRNDLSIVNSLVHRDVLGALLEDRVDPADVPYFAAAAAEYYERRYPESGSKTSELLGKLAAANTISDELIWDLVSANNGFHAPETLVMAYGAYARTPQFPDVAIDAVNLGGDTDSTASIVSAMAVMRDGEVKMPADADKLEDMDRLIRTGRGLVQLIIKKRPPTLQPKVY